MKNNTRKVQIKPAGSKFILWCLKFDSNFQTEKFNSEVEAKDFIKKNKMILVPNDPPTKVKFLIEHDESGDVFAFFPYVIADNNGNKMSYSHIGQHSACHPDYAIKCKTAPKEDYQPLLRELESIGYTLEVIK